MSKSTSLVKLFVGLAERKGWQIIPSIQWFQQKALDKREEKEAKDFESLFDFNKNPLKAWRRACSTVGIQNAKKLESIGQCKKALEGKNANLVDFVAAGLSGRQLRKGKVFTTEEELATYIRREDKVFPKTYIKPNAVLSHFLVEVYRKRVNSGSKRCADNKRDEKQV